MEQEQQSNAQQQEQQRSGQQQEGKQGDEQQQEKRNYSKEEWDARQAEFDRKADKIRRNAARDAELKFRREAAKSQGGEQRQEQQKQETDPEPKRDDFEDYEAFMRAIGRWEGRKAAREEHTRVGKEAEERSRVEQEKRAASEFKKRANTLMDEFPDFAVVIEDAEGVMITDTMGREIQDSPVGPRILYELAKNPEEAARIAELPQKAQVREILKMESRYEAEAAAKAKAKEKGKKNADGSEEDDEADQEQEREDESADAEGKGKGKDEDRGDDGRFKAQEKGPRKAPDPIEPGSGRSANQDRGPTDKDSDSGWMAKRLAQEKAERARQRGK